MTQALHPINLLGLVIGLVGLLLRRYKEVKNEVATEQKQPLKILQSHPHLLAHFAGLPVLTAVVFYLVFSIWSAGYG
jgi:hypothetical protein